MDPQTRTYLDSSEGLNRWETMSVVDARTAHRNWQIQTALCSPANEEGRRAVQSADYRISDDSPVVVRAYTPSGVSADVEKPVIVFFHGGGFVIGDLDTHDELCRELASRVGALVIAVNYRLAPEHRYPSAVVDCIGATKWAIDNARALGADGSRLALVGDSAGGNLAAVVTRALNDERPNTVTFQLLIYPVTDNTEFLLGEPSALEFGEGYELTTDAFAWFQHQYFGDDQDSRYEAEASPVLVDDLSRVPSTLIIIAELDPIADSARRYARRLEDAGVDVRVSLYPGVMHAFVTMGAFFDAAFVAIDESVEVLRTALF